MKIPKLLPHEWLCLGFMLSLWIRLVWATGFFTRDALLLLLVMVSSGAIVALAAWRETDLRWRLRLLFYPASMNAIYFLLATAVPSVHGGREDEALQSLDLWLVGDHPSLWMQRWVNPVATEVLSFCYLWYLFYLFSSQIEYMFTDIDVLKRHYTGLFSIYAIGYACYSLVPAVGPHLAMADQFTVPLEGGPLTRLTSDIVLAASNRVDVFPSLHVAVSVYLLLFDRGHKYWRFLLYLLPCAGLVIATIYLRYHYLTDIICGLGLSFLALWLARDRSLEEKHVSREIANHGIKTQACPHHRRVQRYRLGAGEAVRT
ncbi:MAG: phosphoesterase PA-phosphatase [Gammaproteobacteria bacterium]|nr:phosphoesterase PA-phosphatase [Gammaproteobacteria bacterium]NIM73215.1 phosphoesterase PA-phosphatase [Gammaproteobacteria bacterium]NIN40051.1 phosphoesterase PA-phosphatase [Gammaproteobacteria bacterium]NIO26265.1 phosphoesterase PA-phosphatase [Gammaproteobacteria bacterium]NIO66074.1 phosphoesterase PA-phosphatase [Gammaproteobacteria bacterium]